MVQMNEFPNIHSTHLPYYTCTRRGNSGGQTRLYSCLVLAVNPINNIRTFFWDRPNFTTVSCTKNIRWEICWDTPDCITVSRVNNIRHKGNFWGQTRSLTLADVPADESV